jgi:hypothetical protein
MDLWKYGHILTIEKSITIIWLKFSWEGFFIWVFHLIFEPILNHYKTFKMEINTICLHFLILNVVDQSLFLDFKSPLLLVDEFFFQK